MGTGAIILIVAVVILYASMYNSLVRRRNRVDQAYSSIDVQLTQRYDLLPKLVETVKQYMVHERTLLEDITRLRSQAMSSTTPADKLNADSQLSSALGQLRVQMENYPQLRASENFNQLQRSLNEVEEQIAAARRAYNGAVVDYNNAVQTVPTSFVADMHNFTARTVYEAEARKRDDVDMKQLFNA